MLAIESWRESGMAWEDLRLLLEDLLLGGLEVHEEPVLLFIVVVVVTISAIVVEMGVHWDIGRERRWWG